MSSPRTTLPAARNVTAESAFDVWSGFATTSSARRELANYGINRFDIPPTLPPLATLPRPTPTLAATETALPAAAVVVADSNCDTADLKLYHPARGDTISGAYTIIGDAHVGSGRYRIEVIPAGETAWRFIWEGYKSIQGESMMAPRFQTAMFPNGAYLMKLTLVAASGDENLRCVVPFNIGN